MMAKGGMPNLGCCRRVIPTSASMTSVMVCMMVVLSASTTAASQGQFNLYRRAVAAPVFLPSGAKVCDAAPPTGNTHPQCTE